MAGLAGLGRRLVKQHRVSVHQLLERVAGRAGNILVAALERERRLLVVEERGLPLVAVVAGGAVVALRAELVGMRILVAFAARYGGAW